MALYQYKFGAGWDTPLANLLNPEVCSEFRVNGRNMPPTTQPVNLYPVRTSAMSGRVFGDGNVDHIWRWTVLPREAIALIKTTLALTSAVSAQATINTRVHETNTYERFNCWVELFIPEVDYRYDRRMFRDVVLRFHDLRQI